LIYSGEISADMNLLLSSAKISEVNIDLPVPGPPIILTTIVLFL
jgi:hypothetical protein